jgi:hypothetical protein
MRELHLARRRRGLQVLEPCPPFVDAEYAAADRDSARRHDQHLVAAGVQIGDVLGEAIQPLPADAAIIADQ